MEITVRARAAKYTAHPGMVTKRDQMIIEFPPGAERQLHNILGGAMRGRVVWVDNTSVRIVPDDQGHAFSVKRDSTDGKILCLQYRLEERNHPRIDLVTPAFRLTPTHATISSDLITVALPGPETRLPPKRMNRRGQANRLRPSPVELPLMYPSAERLTNVGPTPAQQQMIGHCQEIVPLEALGALHADFDDARHIIELAHLPGVGVVSRVFLGDREIVVPEEGLAFDNRPPPVSSICPPRSGEVVMTLNGAMFSGDAPTSAIAEFIAEHNLRSS